MEDIVITDEMIAEEQALVEAELAKYEKRKAIEALVVDVNGVPFAGDDISQNRLSATGTIANYLFNKNIGPTLRAQANDEGTDDVTKAMLLGLADIFDGVYQAVYVQQQIGWKNAQGDISMVHGEQVLEALHKSMQEVGKIITGVNDEES